MRRLAIPPRPDWRKTADRLGFRFAEMYGAPYWDETACFAFTLREIEHDIEDSTRELHALCLDLADRAARDGRLLTRLGVTAAFHDYVARSWRNRDLEPSLYGRFDLAYDGTGPAKMLEYNADTPTGLYETAVFQWAWLEELRRSGALPLDADQFNSAHEALVERFKAFSNRSLFHFVGAIDDVEDGGTIDYLLDCAAQAGHVGRKLHIDRVGLDARGRFTDEDDLVIDQMFKLHPWEWIFEAPFASHLPISGCRFVEPPWKAMLSTKAILPLLWEAHPGHPNLLPAFFADDPRAAALDAYVHKPLFSREGANVTLVQDGETVAIEGPYGAEGFVVQQAARLFSSPGGYAVLGSWVVGDAPCGLGVREDASPVTMNMSRFVPHAIIG
ncbi:glutathionylspermidine synthase [Methylopila capsulata]|uniref:Glutathionylspermidine synthase n=1 Tax=Methylopila capsulata TaxID=61654 RepID=A0A9W6ITI2_9HYPH|nr:glutathionylspermidine synthase family protein [Methylopila capsulata]MBM7850650.1 glutathionylspermidine synthase [Methylopila capsulata]GLK55943.1 hypothetical protein GCM10008170_19620 [Methylopila capsulata]